MRAIVLDEHGGPEVLQVRTVPDPVPGPEEVLVDVVATALNRADVLQRMGLYPGPPTEFEIPGLEYAGRVAAVGERVRSWRVGDEVMGIVGGGAYAERLTTHERAALPVPSTVPLTDAAALPEVYLTAYDALVVQGGMTSGRWALVHAGASGVGTAAIQIMKAIGARIIVTASSGKIAACRELGADVAVDYTSESFVEAVTEATGGLGVDCVLDVIGGEYLNDNVDAVRVGGRIIQVGVMGQGKADFVLGKLLPKRAALIGTVLRSRPLEEKIALAQRFRAELMPLFESGAMGPVIDSRFTLDDLPAAHERMESNANVGKILVDVVG
ncbi:MAG: NAD(P)H-quinone oxidoreductase [Actinomycetota bacterium]